MRPKPELLPDVQAAPTPFSHGDYGPPDGTAIFTITLESHPATGRALNLMRENKGGPVWRLQKATNVPVRWQPFMGQIETALKSLSDHKPAPEDPDEPDGEACGLVGSELFSFIAGEHSVMEAIASRSPDHAIASKFLNDFFDSWEAFSDKGFDPLGAS